MHAKCAKDSGRDPDVLLCWGIFGRLFAAREPEMNATQLKRACMSVPAEMV